jgi:mRNA deadenylase 3'-5' endonuclease subunit Ccr4
LHFNAAIDYVRHAQVVYLLEKMGEFIATAQLEKKPAVILSGDFNSEPVSSVMSVLHNESLDLAGRSEGSAASTLNDEQLENAHFYDETEQLHERNLKDGKYDSIPNKAVFKSAYHYYNESSPSRKKTHPPYTQYAADLKGTYDHIMYTSEPEGTHLHLLELLDVPSESTLA